ncbi:DUF3368 domain-containing protein [Candidatus Woesearchaeota archaeon]|nr:DUF3368 domain-containing protein [Candidatus Woesearchaeota archaeon]
MTVSNSTVLINLIKIGKVDLIKNIYKNITITGVIRKEVTREDELYKNEIRVFNELAGSFIIIKNPANLKDFGLHKGENSCLSLCKEIDDITFLSDDKNARKAADFLGIRVIGTLGILVSNLKKKKLNKKEFFTILRKLIDKGFYISTELFAAVEEYVNKIIL